MRTTVPCCRAGTAKRTGELHRMRISSNARFIGTSLTEPFLDSNSRFGSEIEGADCSPKECEPGGIRRPGWVACRLRYSWHESPRTARQELRVSLAPW